MSQFMKAGDPVWIAPYYATWPEWFQQLAQPLRNAPGPAAFRIDHIGSTYVPGLAAKPVIDIQISVADFEPLDVYQLPLERLGYIFRADNSDRSKRYFREAPGHLRVHIHVRQTVRAALSRLCADALRCCFPICSVENRIGTAVFSG